MTSLLRALFSVIRREIERMRSRTIYLFVVLILPIFSFLIFLVIFSSGVIREIPVSVIDNDQTGLSRQLIRMLESNPSLKISYRPLSLSEGERLMYNGKSYACILIPKDFERDVLHLRAPRVYNYYNNQYLLVGGTLYKEVYLTVRTLSLGISLNVRLKKGEPYSSAKAGLQPIEVQNHILFNPYTNYLYYLAGSLLPNMLHMFVLLSAIFSFGIELKEKTAGELWALSEKSYFVFVIGKCLPYTFLFSILGILMNTLLFKYCGVPLRGSPFLVGLATFMFILSYQSMGVFFVTVMANLRLALMGASFYASTAYTFIGMTFPIIAFPLPAKIWAYCLPLTHFMKIFINESIAGVPHSVSFVSFAALACFILMPLTVSFRFRKIMTDEKYWGRP